MPLVDFSSSSNKKLLVRRAAAGIPVCRLPRRARSRDGSICSMVSSNELSIVMLAGTLAILGGLEAVRSMTSVGMLTGIVLEVTR